MAWQNPKTDWAVNPKNPVAEDFNRIEGNIAFLKDDIETKKGAIVNALNTVGLETQLTDTHAQIANKILAANQGTKIYTPGTANITIPKGFHSGQGYVKGDVNLVPENIAKGKSIFGVIGGYASNVIQNMQYGLYSNYGSTSSKSLQEVTIQPVDLDCAVLLPINILATDSRWDGQSYPLDAVYLVDNQTISSTSYAIGEYWWMVIELNPDIVKSIQRGILNVTKDNNGVLEIPINPVILDKSFVIVQGGCTSRSTSTSDTQIYGAAGWLTHEDTLCIDARYSNVGYRVSWQVIEFV